MIRMLRAYAVERIDGWVTLARMVLVGPVLKNRKNTARNTKIHAQGNGSQKGVRRTRRISGNERDMLTPDTRKYEPEKRLRRRSPAMPPRSVAVSPEITTMAPKSVLTCPRLCRAAA